MAVAFEFERAAKPAKRGELVEAQARKVLNDITARADIGEAVQAETIEACFRRWTSGREARKSAGAGERYRGAVGRFLEFLGKRAEKPLTALMARDVEGFLDTRLQDGMASRTVVLEFRALRHSFTSASSFFPPSAYSVHCAGRSGRP